MTLRAVEQFMWCAEHNSGFSGWRERDEDPFIQTQTHEVRHSLVTIGYQSKPSRNINATRLSTRLDSTRAKPHGMRNKRRSTSSISSASCAILLRATDFDHPSRINSPSFISRCCGHSGSHVCTDRPHRTGAGHLTRRARPPHKKILNTLTNALSACWSDVQVRQTTQVAVGSIRSTYDERKGFPRRYRSTKHIAPPTPPPVACAVALCRPRRGLVRDAGESTKRWTWQLRHR